MNLEVIIKWHSKKGEKRFLACTDRLRSMHDLSSQHCTSSHLSDLTSKRLPDPIIFLLHYSYSPHKLRCADFHSFHLGGYANQNVAVSNKLSLNLQHYATKTSTEVNFTRLSGFHRANTI